MKPKLLNSEMVRAVLDGRKTQTRRPIKDEGLRCIDFDKNPVMNTPLRHKEGKWFYEYQSGICDTEKVLLKPPHQVGDILGAGQKVTGVRAERIQDTSVKDIIAEGVTPELIRSLLKPVKTKQGHWISGNDYDQTCNYCYDCAKPIVEKENQKAENTDCIIDGGWESHDSDYVARCETCDCLLNFNPTDDLIETEIDAFEQGDCGPYTSDENRYLLDMMLWLISDRSDEIQDRLMRLCWKYYWGSIYPGSWERNDWAWVTEF